MLTCNDTGHQRAAEVSEVFTRIDHVGVAVPDLDEAIAFYERTFGMRCVHVETNEEQGVREAMLAVGDGSDPGPAARARHARVADRPLPGPQRARHAAHRLRGRRHRGGQRGSCAATGLRLLYDEPRRGTAGSLINFVHPKDAGGVLVELVEQPSGRPGRRSGEGDPRGDPGRRRHGRVVRRAPGAATYIAVTVHRDEQDMFAGMAARDKDPRRSLHVEEVPTPELGPGEALVAVMASAINYNTVWTSIFEPVSTFGFLERYGRTSPLAKRHDLPYHVVGSDLSGVVLRTGPGVHAWHPGDEVVAHCLSVELESPLGHNDTMLDPEQRIWGFETNFGGLAQLALVKSNQLLDKPAHLTWEEAAVPGLVNSTAYRQLVSRNGAGMKQGDIVLIWGASGGLGSYATQLALGGGATPVCVVSSEEKAEICRSHGRRADHRPHRGGLPVLEGRAHPGPARSGSGWASGSASSPAATTSTSCSSTRAGRRSARRCTSRARAARSSPARRRAGSCTSTTTATCG